MKLNLTRIPGLILFTLCILFSGCKTLANSPEVVLTETPSIQNSVIAKGIVIPQKETKLFSETSGPIISLPIETGDWVEQGQILVTIGNQETLIAEQKTIEAELLIAQQNLDDLILSQKYDRVNAWLQVIDARESLDNAQRTFDNFDKNRYEDDLKNLKEEMITAKQAFDDATGTLEKYETLDQENPTYIRYQKAADDAELKYNEVVRRKSQLEYRYERIINTLVLAEASLEMAEHVYEKYADGPEQDLFSQLSAQIEALNSRQEAVKSRLAKHTLTAPFSGEIMVVNGAENEVVTPGQIIIQLADTTKWLVETTDLNEMEVVQISLGQPVSVEAEAFPGIIISGFVSEINNTPSFQLGDVLYTSKIQLEENIPLLKWGMTVTISFEPSAVINEE